MRVQVIEKDGKPLYAVIPFEDYESLLLAARTAGEDQDLAAIRAAIDAGEETYPPEFVEKLIETDSKLREWRKYRGMTQVQLAEKASISQGAIATIERGKRTPNMGTARRLALTLQCDIDDLFGHWK
ncbi:MAG: XRE family transcriptional regulator [Xanthomonadales bacterium]|nr:XRE family transcriptional regulator [Xanthomonadales bacterium]